MTQAYKLPIMIATADFTEKKSRFIANISPVSTEEEALDFLRSIREKHREASHNVYAYRIKNNNIQRYNDDGEPSGTAGMPLLDTFVKQEIYDFCCVATRYFGGILLGAGGLIRAYARCGTIAVEKSGVGIMRELTSSTITLPYPIFENIKRVLNENDVKISSEDFAAEVTITFTLPTENLPPLKQVITELTAGKIDIEEQEKQMSVW